MRWGRRFDFDLYGDHGVGMAEPEAVFDKIRECGDADAGFVLAVVVENEHGVVVLGVVEPLVGELAEDPFGDVG